MAINQEELGQRLERARGSCAMTQDDVAGHLEVSRATIDQMELGKRAVTGLELSRLAHLYGQDLRSFVADKSPPCEDVLGAFFRLHPELSNQEDVLQARRACMELGRELTNLERLLNIDRNLATVASYPLPQPQTKWRAIQKGQQIALEERRRLGLGLAPLPDVAELLEAQGIRTAQVNLPDSISGLTLIEPAIGFFVTTNRKHHLLRRRFSYAHEYCHVLVDRGQGELVSQEQDRDEPLEVRANAFAASFLIPTDAARQFIQALGKGHPSRMEAEVFDGEAPVQARARSAPGSQDIQNYDVVQFAHHFGVSWETACYRLYNTQLLTRAELGDLLNQGRAGRGRELEKLLGLPEPDHCAQRNEFRRRFVGLALEAFRREEISQSKLIEIAAMVDVDAEDVGHAILGMGTDDGIEVRLPGG